MTDMPRMPRITIDPAAFQAADARAAAQLRAMRDALRPFAKAHLDNLRRVLESLRPLAEWAEAHPQELARWQRRREAEARLGSCNCLCGFHREQAESVCLSVAEPGLSVRFDSPTVGVQDVAMCRPCFEARQAVPV